MSERSEPKQVCRRNALAFLGCAAVFGLVASSALLTVTRLKPKPPRRPPRRRRPQIRRSLVPSGVRKGERGAQKGVRNVVRDAQSGVRSVEQGATSDVMRATTSLPPNKKSNSRVGGGPVTSRQFLVSVLMAAYCRFCSRPAAPRFAKAFPAHCSRRPGDLPVGRIVLGFGHRLDVFGGSRSVRSSRPPGSTMGQRTV